jgi:AraC family transcriptional regulator
MEQLERVVYRGDRIEVGAFRCPAARPDFDRAGPIRDHCVFVFPRTAVRIRHEGRRAFTADPAVVTFYNPGQPYTRERLDPRGDLCEWFALDPALARQVVRELDERAAEHAQAPLPFSHGPSDGATYLRQRELFLLLARGDGVDPLAIEETVLLMLERLLRLAYAAWPGTRVRAQPLRARDRDAALRARELLGLRFRDALSLRDLAGAVGLSRFRLCRAFRQAEGTTMHAFREQLRLRAALEPLGQGCDDLTALALDLGYSSHSHFTANFRTAFGITPSQARTRLLPSGRR